MLAFMSAIGLIVYYVGLYECNRVKACDYIFRGSNAPIFMLPPFLIMKKGGKMKMGALR